uniref:Uncharacterized protein n=1 Tax=Agrobacterium albertimagni TaxID=147266 RepID=A0A7C1NVC9_9HYPH
MHWYTDYGVVVAGGVSVAPPVGAGAAGAGSVAGGGVTGSAAGGVVVSAGGGAGASAGGAAGVLLSVAGVAGVSAVFVPPKTKKAPAAITTISRMAMPQVAPPPAVVCWVTCGR